MVVKCPNCGSADIDSQESTGQSVCMECGMVLEENAITHSIEFQVRTEFTNWQNSIVLLSYTPVHFTSSPISIRNLETVLMLSVNMSRQVVVR